MYLDFEGSSIVFLYSIVFALVVLIEIQDDTRKKYKLKRSIIYDKTKIRERKRIK
ncbi:hypothetical protein [Poseidonibacter lekithochrous]|uniref:hypothetical protein n=1 Tax=Poseidonibacter lekithochrous TaxID=1904463 RepID=UPI0013D8F039|nr:hypothetical protein [Poseidonibacter lekithochrous]